MKPYPLLFKPSLKERIWGGSRLKELYNCTNLQNPVGESWIISDHPEGRSLITNGELAGKSLSELLSTHPHWLCGHALNKFPLLVKLLDTSDDLSVQIHPGDEYAFAYENGETGKTECWYIIECEPGAEIVLGHNAKSKTEFMQLLK